MGLSFSSPSSGAIRSHKNGHVYTSIVTRDNAQAHYGDRIAVQNYNTNYSIWPPSSSARDAEPPRLEQRGPKRKRIQDVDVEGPSRQGQDPVDMAIDHLGQLYLSIQHLQKDRDAQKLAKWIRLLVGAFTDEHAESQLEHTLDGLESLQNGLVSVNRVSINSAPSSRRSLLTHVYEVKRKSSVIVVGSWEIRLDTVIRDSIDTKGREVSESFSSLRLKPAGGAVVGGTSLSAFFGERTDHLQRSFFSPTIITYRTRDNSSEVFDLVYDDDVDGLIRLIALQKASARDCDADGRSLLFLACFYNSLECSKFSIDCGVDVNRLDTNMVPKYIDYSSTPLHLAVDYVVNVTAMLSGAIEPAKDRDQFMLVQLLLEAEADPTSITFDDRKSHTSLTMALNRLDTRGFCFGDAGHAQVHDMVRLLLNGVYADLKTPDPTSGFSIWLQACIVAQPTILRMLSSSGCDTSETYEASRSHTNEEDYVSGWNCLFFVVLHASQPESSDGFESLQFLFSTGANPFLRDADGKTIFDYVNEDTYSEFAHYRRDLWHSALDRAHIDVGHHTKQISVLPVFSERYTPIHHRALHNLESWNKSDVESQVNALLEQVPWTEAEAEVLWISPVTDQDWTWHRRN